MILITTKRAKEGQLSIDYNGSFSMMTRTRHPEQVSPKRFMELQNEANWNDAGNPEGRDYFTYDNREFSALLTQLGINHEHIERSGGHDWTFWSACTPKILRKVGALFREGTTSIDNVRTTVRKPQGIYSLDGRRHNSLQRGINIVDGRKVVIK